MKELEFVSSDVRATDEEWKEFEDRDDLFSFYPPDVDIVYVLRLKSDGQEKRRTEE